jgi:DNA-binding CsgD family transcriptional regulator
MASHEPNNAELPPTPRQLEALQASLMYGSQKAAAHQMGISPQQLKNHLTRLYKRLDVVSMPEAAIALGWLRIPGYPAPLTVEPLLYPIRQHLKAIERLLPR